MTIIRLAMPPIGSRSWCLVVIFVFAFGWLDAVAADSGPANSHHPDSASGKPNILFIFADDQSYETIGALGNSQIKTPHLDQLVRQGVSFSNAYNMGSWSGAVCVASRTMLNTGKFIWRAKANQHKQMIEEKKTWAQLMSSAGYETYFSGKWHVGPIKPNRVFDHVVNVRPGMPNQTPEGYVRPVEGKPDPWSPYDPKFGGFWKGGKHWSEVLADDATQFLHQAKGSEKPFFMYLAFNAPHDPRQSPKAFVDMYPTESMEVPRSFLPEYPFKQEMGCFRPARKKGGILRDENLAPFPRTEYAIRVNRREYYALITHMDEQIGRILAVLRETGQHENTYIMFTADHGLACGHHGLLGKQNMYEHSVKPPLIVTGPNVPANSKRTAPVYLQDVMATSLDLAGAEDTEHVEFNSLLPLIDDADANGSYPATYGCYLDKQRMIRIKNWKLIVYPEARKMRLFDLADDPLEMKDVADRPENRNRVSKMFDELVALSKKMDDSLDLTEVFAE